MGHLDGGVCRTETSRWPATATTIASPSSTTSLGSSLTSSTAKGFSTTRVVIITSDHGESFGDHGLYLHGTSLYLDEIGVPLVILSPDAPANRVVNEPVSLRDLPATVVERLGSFGRLTVPGSLAGSLLVADTARALPESDAGPFRARHARPRSGSRRPEKASGAAMSRCLWWPAAGILSAMASDPRQLYDLNRTRSRRELGGCHGGKASRGDFRRMLLKVLERNRGTIEAENAYLKAYRQWLKSIIEYDPPSGEPISPKEKRPNNIRE